MNPLVQDMLLAQREDLELRNLEGLLEDDCKCESAHMEPIPTCSGDVVARKTTKCRGLDFNICSISYALNRESVESGYKVCSDCGVLTSLCWTIRPI